MSRTLPYLVLSDLDGTLADHSTRPNLPHDVESYVQWQKTYVEWHKLCLHDLPIWNNIFALRSLWSIYTIEIVTARPAEARPETETWLVRHNVRYNGLRMRPVAEAESAVKMKHAWATSVYRPEDVLLVLENDPTCVGMWRDAGYHVLHTFYVPAYEGSAAHASARG